MAMISTIEAAKELAIGRRAVLKLLAKRRIIGAQLIGSQWVIPSPVARVPPARGPQPKTTNSLAVHFSSNTVEWSTPRNIIDLTIRTLGEIDLDPCSNVGKSVPAHCHFTTEKDGLSRYWYGRVYMNPPYGDVIGLWAKHLCREYKAGRITEAIALVPARTDTQWFGLFSAFPQCFIRGRLKFGDNEMSAPFPSVAIYLGRNTERFASIFSDIGRVVHGI